MRWGDQRKTNTGQRVWGRRCLNSVGGDEREAPARAYVREQITDARFPRTNRWEFRARLLWLWLLDKPPRRRRRTVGRCLNYLESRWSLPAWPDPARCRPPAPLARERPAKKEAPPITPLLSPGLA